MTQIVFLLLAGVGLSYLLDISAGHQFPIITILCLFGAFLAYVYSAPPPKLNKMVVWEIMLMVLVILLGLGGVVILYLKS